MANEMVQGLLQNLLQPQQGPNPADIMTALASRNPMAAVSAMQAPQLSQMFGQQFRDLVGGLRGQPAAMTGNEAYIQAIQQLSAQPDFMNTSDSLAKLAAAASAVGRTPEAMQFSMLASQARTQEAEKAKTTMSQSLQRNTNISAIDQAIASVDATKYPGLVASLVGYKNQLATEETPSDPDKVQTTTSNLFTRHKVENPLVSKVDVKDFEFPSGEVLSLQLNESGNVFYNKQWQDPASLGLRTAAGRSQSAVKQDQQLDPVAIQGLLQEQTVRGNLPADPNDPIARGFLDQVRGGLITTAEQANKYFEGLPGTPAAIQKQAQISNNLISSTGPSLRNMQQVFSILNDPNSNVGGWKSITEDYPFGTDAQRLKDALLPVVSDAAFQQINQMKTQAAELGGTGTGLGQVAIPEFEALQNRIENLKTSRTKEDLQQAASDYMVHMLNIRNIAAQQPIAVIKGDPTYIGMSIEPAEPNAGFDGYMIMNGQRVPINIYDSSDDYLGF